jgi:lipopolysaccharide/colanic/teichoic acid biosynthesis glycosyltransferase
MPDEPNLRPPVAARSSAGPAPALVVAGARPQTRHQLRASRRDQRRRSLLALADISAILAALAIALAVMTPASAFADELTWGSLTIFGWPMIFTAYGLYARDCKRISHTTVDEIPQLFHALVVGTVLLWLFFDIGPTRKITFLAVLTFGVCALAGAVMARAAVRIAVRRLLAPERVLFLGAGPLSDSLVQKMGDLERLTQHRRVDRIILANTRADTDELLKLLSACRQLRLKVSVIPTVFEAIGPAIEVDDVEGVTVLALAPPILPRSSRLVKRAIDIVGAGAVLLLSLPLLLVIALAIKLDSPGPALFIQRRIGKGGTPFRMVKFRTMVDGAERRREQLISDSADPNWIKLDHDPRITRIGGLLRSASLDELPQLWNVLKGEMSLVGPRPLPEPEDRLIGGWGRQRLDLTPGITGYWQVLGRTSISFTEMVKLDYVYVTNWSLWTDVRLILRTLPAVLSRRGVN